ncbi:MAG TPA: hypothetical protein QF514_00060 [Candidatus Thalassarchaeaceae archaeon]|jgi:hypothetical protein|nr:hypothetical protein [Candidatus Thalassarchaeaceae archaeon]MDP6844431.1 hypothetical protein [Candidatus Thalassarchaeaceae archaeon]HJM40601.1 hypothetical protein [Candidatus Thalassarchaeaceae archaeon]
MKRVILLIVSGICAILMIGGMIGYTYEDSIENVPVPMTGTAVGFADEPLTESAIPSALISPELTITWDSDVWVGLVNEEEYQRCSPSDGISSTCGPTTTNFAAGGPSSQDAKTFTFDIGDDVYYPVDGQSFGGTESSVDVDYSVKVTLAWPVIIFLGALGTGLQVLGYRLR